MWKYLRSSCVSFSRTIIINIIIIVITTTATTTIGDVFTSALANGISLEFEWPQIYSILQDICQYSVRSQ